MIADKKWKLKKVYIIGTGILAVSCAEYAKQQGAETVLYDMGRSSSVMMEKQASQKKITYFYEKPAEVFSILCQTDEEILLVSAINEWIVPAKVLEKKNITAINLHQALLPAHPGRNAEAWAIYEQDEKAGITWHHMVSKVDKGEILIQKEIRILENTTAFSLFRQQIACAFEGFQEIFSPLMQGQCRGRLQTAEKKGKFHFNKDVPNDGWLDPAWDGKKMSAFLRATDYGILKIWEAPRICLGEDVFLWQKYEVQKQNKPGGKPGIWFLEEEKNGTGIFHIRIRKDDVEILLKKCKKVEEK